jgi:hypothetical protein
VEARVQALLEDVDNSPPQSTRPYVLQILKNSSKFRKVCGIDGVPNECFRHLRRRPLEELTHLLVFSHCLRLSHFPNPWKEAKVITLPNPVRNPKFTQNLRPISLPSTTCKLFEKSHSENNPKHIEQKGSSLSKPVWFPFTSQHDTAMCQANRPRDP